MLSYQNVFHAWYPERFRPADIRIEETAAAADRGAAAQRDVAAAFSAGVDSSYTLLRHLDECAADPGHRVTHAIFVHGFDIPLEDAATFEDAARAYLNALGPLGVELIPMRTNAREVGERAAAAASVSWDDLHGAALASVPMMLDRRIRRFYLPASFAYTDLRPWGSHPVCDPFLSTDTMEVDHDGAEERNVKIAALADWAPAQGWLRVCWKKPSATENCCVCYKCVLTMFCLELVGALAAFRTFPKPLSRPAIRALSLPVTEWAYAERLVWLARAAGKNDIAGELAVALARSRRGRQDSRFRRPWRRKG
jgi:hypothetical protein